MVSNATFNTISVISCGQKTPGRGVLQYVIKFVSSTIFLLTNSANSVPGITLKPQNFIYILMFVADKMSLGRLCQSLIVTGEKL
jgi:hypothetical protein